MPRHPRAAVDAIASDDALAQLRWEQRPSPWPDVARAPRPAWPFARAPPPALRGSTYGCYLSQAHSPFGLYRVSKEPDADRMSFAQLREAYILAGQRSFRRGGGIRPDELLAAVRTVQADANSVANRAYGRSFGFRLDDTIRRAPALRGTVRWQPVI